MKTVIPCGEKKTAAVFLDEERLSRVLYYLPQDDEMRAYLQAAGEAIFGWGKR